MSWLNHLQDWRVLFISCFIMSRIPHVITASFSVPHQFQSKSWCKIFGRRKSVMSSCEVNSSKVKQFPNLTQLLVYIFWALTVLLIYFFSYQLKMQEHFNHTSTLLTTATWLLVGLENKKRLFLDRKCHGNTHWVMLMLGCKISVFS